MEIKEIRKELENTIPETLAMYRKIAEEDFDTFCRKQYDYGSGNISVGTNLKTVKERNFSLTGLWFRMNDKIQRIKTLLAKGTSAVNEPMTDAFKDLSVYGVICRIVESGVWGK